MARYDAKLSRLERMAAKESPSNVLQEITLDSTPELENAIAGAESILAKPLSALTKDDKGGALWDSPGNEWPKLATALIHSLPK